MTSGRSTVVDLHGLLVHQTEKAFLLDIDGTKAWVAKSQCEDNGDGTFTIPEYVAIEKGWV